MKRFLTTRLPGLVTIAAGLCLTASAADNRFLPCPDTQCTPKVCVPKTEVKKVDRRVYDCAHEDFCIRCCSLFGRMFNWHSCGDCPLCEDHVRTRKVLVVKIRKDERCETKCVVEQAPVAPCIIPSLPPLQIGVPNPPPPMPVPAP